MSCFQWGCATYQSQVAESRMWISTGQYDKALEKLKPLSEKQDGDQLVHLLDYGTALQMSGELEESNRIFLQADKLSEMVDYHSISRVTGSLLFSQEMVQYKGDTFEKIFINAYLAMNFLELGKLDDALVESRRINEKYTKQRLEDKQPFELNPFAKYLSAVAWEADQKWDDAYIAYSEAYKLSPDISPIRADLIRTAKMARREEDYKKWKSEFSDISEKTEWYDRNYGELVIIYQQGWGPRKDYSPGSYRFPTLRPVHNLTQRARLNIESVGSFDSQFVYNVETAAIKTLQEDYGALAAKRVAGFVAKEVVADQIRQKDEALGLIAWLGMHISDRADLRQWSFLPQKIEFIRVFLKPGTYKISLHGLNSNNSPTGENMPEREIQIKPRRKIFLNWRSYQ